MHLFLFLRNLGQGEYRLKTLGIGLSGVDLTFSQVSPFFSVMASLNCPFAGRRGQDSLPRVTYIKLLLLRLPKHYYIFLIKEL